MIDLTSEHAPRFVKEVRPDDGWVVGGVTRDLVARLVDDQRSTLLARFRPPEIHRERDIENLAGRRGEPDMKRQAFAAPGRHTFREIGGADERPCISRMSTPSYLSVLRDKTCDEVVVALKARPALLLDPADGELKWNTRGPQQNRHQGEIDRNRLADEIRRPVPAEVIEQDLESPVRIDAILGNQDPRRSLEAEVCRAVHRGHVFHHVWRRRVPP